MPRRKTHAEFVEEMTEKNPGVEALGTYFNSRTKLAVRCRACGHQWDAMPRHLLQGTGCPECAKASRRKTHAEFVAEIAELHPALEVVGEYRDNNKTKVAVRCRTCGHEWDTAPKVLLKGSGCPECAEVRRARASAARRRTHDEFVSKMAELNPGVEVLGTYTNSYTKIAVRCRTCGHEREAEPHSLLRGHGCPECAKARQRQAGMERRIRGMAAAGLLSAEDVALLGEWGFPFGEENGD